MAKIVTIAIDGPSGAGKSSVAKVVAKKFNLTYVDTGAMYRAFTYAVIKAGLDPKNEEESCSLIGKTSIELRPDNSVFCNGEDVTQQIREFAVSSNVSYIASYKDIRLEMVELQRQMGVSQSIIMDGRDIGTYVFPKADLKIFLKASLQKRAERRYVENISKGIACTLEKVTEDLAGRDKIDSSRAFAPLKPAEDSIHIDRSDMTIYEVITAISDLIKTKLQLKEYE